jgi:hypothetical protein
MLTALSSVPVCLLLPFISDGLPAGQPGREGLLGTTIPCKALLVLVLAMC